MSTTLEPVTRRTKAGTCPACQAYLWADVDIAVTVSEPEFRGGQARVHTSTRLVSMTVAHSCWIDDEGERQSKDTHELLSAREAQPADAGGSA